MRRCFDGSRNISCWHGAGSEQCLENSSASNVLGYLQIAMTSLLQSYRMQIDACLILCIMPGPDGCDDSLFDHPVYAIERRCRPTGVERRRAARHVPLSAHVLPGPHRCCYHFTINQNLVGTKESFNRKLDGRRADELRSSLRDDCAMMSRFLRYYKYGSSSLPLYGTTTLMRLLLPGKVLVTSLGQPGTPAAGPRC
jgi:hypothetical protein